MQPSLTIIHNSYGNSLPRVSQLPRLSYIKVKSRSPICLTSVNLIHQWKRKNSFFYSIDTFPQPLNFALYLCMYLWYGKYIPFAFEYTFVRNHIHYNNAVVKQTKKKKNQPWVNSLLCALQDLIKHWIFWTQKRTFLLKHVRAVGQSRQKLDQRILQRPFLWAGNAFFLKAGFYWNSWPLGLVPETTSLIIKLALL